MPKLIKVRYYKPNGEKGIASYNISIAKKIADEVGFTDKDDLIVIADKDKIIIKKKSE